MVKAVSFMSRPKTATPTKITSWSFSRYNVYKQCPAKAKYLFIDKMKEPASDAMARGAAIHNLAEDYLKGKIARLPIELGQFEDVFKALRAQYKKKISGVIVEDTWAFTKDWTVTAWNDWVGCWLRIKLDCAHLEDGDTLHVKDWKTGKFREQMNEEYMEQLSLYALGALMLMPHVNHVVPLLMYLDTGEVYPPENSPIVYSRTDLPALKKEWEKKIKSMLSDTRFAPRANDKCRWCAFSAAKDGPCKF